MSASPRCPQATFAVWFLVMRKLGFCQWLEKESGSFGTRFDFSGPLTLFYNHRPGLLAAENALPASLYPLFEAAPPLMGFLRRCLMPDCDDVGRRGSNLSCTAGPSFGPLSSSLHCGGDPTGLRTDRDPKSNWDVQDQSCAVKRSANRLLQWHLRGILAGQEYRGM